MFKQLTVYRIAPTWAPDMDTAAQALATVPFVACAPTQQLASGFVPPREEHGAMLESVGGQWIACLQVESRKVPTDALKKRAEEIAGHIEQQTGRRPGRRQMKELKEQALLELLPASFTKTSRTLVWIDPKARTLVLDSTSQSRADAVVTLLVKALDGLGLSLIQTEMSPAVAMAHWLGTGEPPYQFSIDRECELKSPDEMKSVVRYGRHNLDTDEVKQHIQAGKVPTRVAMTWRDRVSMVLTESLQVKKLAFLDVVFEGAASKSAGSKTDKAEAFDADVAISTGELVQMLPDLLNAMGGEAETGSAK